MQLNWLDCNVLNTEITHGRTNVAQCGQHSAMWPCRSWRRLDPGHGRVTPEPKTSDTWPPHMANGPLWWRHQIVPLSWHPGTQNSLALVYMNIYNLHFPMKCYDLNFLKIEMNTFVLMLMYVITNTLIYFTFLPKFK